MAEIPDDQETMECPGCKKQIRPVQKNVQGPPGKRRVILRCPSCNTRIKRVT